MSSEEWFREFPEFDVNPPPSGELLEQFESQVGPGWDVDYREFIRRHDGGEGFLSEEVFLRILSIRSARMRTSAIADFGRKLLCFASDGGDTVFAFDVACSGWPVLMLSLTSASPEDIRQVASGFRDFVDKLSRGEISWVRS